MKRSSTTILTSGNANITTQGHLGFTLTPDTYKDVIRAAKQNKGIFNSYKDLTTTELFSPLLEKEVDFLEVECYYDISNWEKYKAYLKSKMFQALKRPKILEWRDKND